MRHGLPASLRAPLAWAAATLALCLVLRERAPLHLDTARDLLIARECALGTHCPQAGPPTSFSGLSQGALWIRALEVRERLGLRLVTVERAMDALLVAAAFVVPLLGRRGLGRRAGPVAFAMWSVGTRFAVAAPTLWNLSPSPLVLALAAAALLGAAAEGATWRFALAGIALGAAVDLHVAWALLVPFAAAVAVATARRWWLAVPLVLALPVAFFALDAPGAFAIDRAAVAPHALAIAVGAVALGALGGAARPLLHACAPAARAEAIAWAEAVFLVAALGCLRLATGHPVEARYLGPLVAPGAILVADRARPLLARLAWRRWLALPRVEATVAVAVLALHLAIVLPLERRDHALRLREAETVGAHLYASGVSFADLYRHLRGPHAFDLMALLGALEPPAHPPAPPLDVDLLVTRDAARTDGDEALDLGGGATATVRRYHPFIGLDPVEVCRRRDGAAPECYRVPLQAADLDGAREPGWMARAYPGMGSLRHLFPGGFGGARVTFRLPLRVPPGARPRRIELVDEPPNLDWRIERVDGVASDGTLPGRAITVGARPGEGAIVFGARVPPDADWAFHRWLPPFVEAD